jgi:hypothetical protein
MLALYPRKDPVWEARVSLGERSATEFSIGHLVNGREAVDEVMRQSASTRRKWPSRLSPHSEEATHATSMIPNGRLWEVARNPQICLEE